MKTTTSPDLILVRAQPTEDAMTKADERFRESRKLIRTKDLSRRVLAKIREDPKTTTAQIPSRTAVKIKEVLMKTSNQIWISQKVSNSYKVMCS